MCAPYVRAGLPYWEKEDEAHHFNRTVEMVKEGRFNPNYFHKPSFHFYLRMPVVAASFLWEAKKGGIKRIEEIVTRDPNGLAGYSFSAWPIRVAVWSRAFSLLLSLGVLILSMLLAKELGAGVLAFAPLIAGAILISSPDFISISSTIGVDMPMTLLCLASTLCALRYSQVNKKQSLYFSFFFAGLAFSTKYNALPILVAPLSAILLSSGCGFSAALIGLLVFSLAFLAASPFVLSNLPLFLNHLAYELWHYGTAGHVGHTAEPGLDQVIHYLSWLSSSAIGAMGLFVMLLGVIRLLAYRPKPLFIFAAFPFCFFLLMSLQRANFERNMLVILPYIAVLAAIAPAYFLDKTIHYKPTRILGFFSVLAILSQPFFSSISERSKLISLPPDSRIQASSTLLDLTNAGNEVAIDATLEFSRDVIHKAGIGTMSGTELSTASLWLDGYDIAVVSGAAERLSSMIVAKFGTNPISDRILSNPLFSIIQLKKEAENYLSISQQNPTILPCQSVGGDLFACFSEATLQTGESYSWTTKRLQKISLNDLEIDINGPVKVTLEAMSPWEGEELSLVTNSTFFKFSPKLEPGAFKEISVEIPNLKSDLYLYSKLLRSPRDYGLSQDPRRLGVAIRTIRLESVK